MLREGGAQALTSLRMFVVSAGRVCKIHFAHAGQIFMMALCQITDERAFVEDIISSRLSPTDLDVMQKRVNDVFVGE